MKKNLETPCVASVLTIATVVLLAGCGPATGNNSGSSNGEFAEVTSITAVTKTVVVAREECRDELVTRTRETKDPNKIVGTVAGAVIGGMLGNEIGSGKGNDAATVGGAVLGGYAGNRVQEGMQDKNTWQETVRNCEMVNDSTEEPAGYEVTYLLNGIERSIHMNYDPGPRIAVANGVLVLNN